MNPRWTVKEIATAINVEEKSARGLLSSLEECALAFRRGQRAPESGRGAPTQTYDFADGFEDAFATILKNAKLTG